MRFSTRGFLQTCDYNWKNFDAETRRRREKQNSEAARPHPETFLPGLSGSDVLQLFIYALVRKIHGIGNPGHGLEANEVAARAAGRIDDDRFIVGAEDHLDPL